MKVGIISADPRKVCWKTYFYHGIWRRCRVSCEPEPWWYVPTPPYEPPPSFKYEGNVMPLANPDTLYVVTTRGSFKQYIMNGDIYVVESLIDSSSSYIQYGFKNDPHAVDEFHVKIHVPFWVVPDRGHYPLMFSDFVFYVPGTAHLYMHKRWLTDSNGNRVLLAYVEFDFGDLAGLHLPFTDTITIDTVRRPGTDIWDCYFNGGLAGNSSGTRIYFDFWSMGGLINGGKVGMDYFREWIDTPSTA